MTDIDKKIAELEELRAKATPGPWYEDTGGDILASGPYDLHLHVVCERPHNPPKPTEAEIKEQFANMALIVAEHNLMPELIDELGEMKERVEKAEAKHTRTATAFDDAMDNALDKNKKQLAKLVAANARAEQMQKERDVLLTRFDTEAWKTDCRYCVFRKDDKQYCGFKNCSEAAAVWATQEAAKREEEV